MALLTQPQVRLGLWALLVFGAALTAHRPSLDAFLRVAANPLAVVDERRVHAWGALLLCALGLALKREAIGCALSAPQQPVYWLLGAGLLAGSSWLFAPGALLAAALGLFALLFGRAVLWPLVLFGLYLLAVGFPTVVETVAEQPLSLAVSGLVGFALRALGYPVDHAGQYLTIMDRSGQAIRVLVTSACSGPATMGVFLAIFGLMAIDRPLPWRASLGLLAVGVLGTWLQNIGRLVGLLLAGHYHGQSALLAAHEDSGYLLFIAWYFVFTMAYFQVGAWLRKPAAGRDAPTRLQPA